MVDIGKKYVDTRAATEGKKGEDHREHLWRICRAGVTDGFKGHGEMRWLQMICCGCGHLCVTKRQRASSITSNKDNHIFP